MRTGPQTLSEARRSAHTPAAQRLEVAFSRYPQLNPSFDFTEFKRQEWTKDGKQKTYRPDIFLPDLKIAIEVEGIGSSSLDNDERDAFFREQGIKVIHVPNQMAARWANEIAAMVVALA